jgi:hypothetical protein
MEIGVTLVAILIVGTVLTSFLFLIFAQVTVRKLEKNPVTKHALGAEFVSGQRIVHAACALVLPLWYFRRARQNPMSIINANAELVRQYTNGVDKFLAHLFFWPFVTTGFGGAICSILWYSGAIK